MSTSPAKRLTLCRRNLTQALQPVTLLGAHLFSSPLPGLSCMKRMVGVGKGIIWKTDALQRHSPDKPLLEVSPVNLLAMT